MFRHPNYYKNLRKLARNSELHVRPISGSEACDTDQAISDSPESRVRDSVRPGPGQQASSSKQQASSRKRLEAVE